MRATASVVRRAVLKVASMAASKALKEVAWMVDEKDAQKADWMVVMMVDLTAHLVYCSAKMTVTGMAMLMERMKDEKKDY
jgi:hypothetical protein